MGELPARLQEIVEDFGFCEGQEKLEYLLEFAEALPPLPEQFSDKRDEMEEVHECITPVFIYAEANNGRSHFIEKAQSQLEKGQTDADNGRFSHASSTA